MNLQQIIARLAAIQADIETRGDSITAEELSAYETEVNSLREQRSQLENAAQLRQSLLANIASGREGVVIDTPMQRGTQHQAPEDPHGTMEYRQAFMKFMQTGAMDPILRTDQVTTTTDVTTAIPTTILNEVIRKMGAFGQLYSRVRKTSIAGGVQVPVVSLKPTATWITEATKSDRQKITTPSVVFNYYGLECKVAQSVIAAIATVDAFEAAVVDMIYEAMIAKLEAGIISGTGTGEMLGVTVDTNVAVGQKVTIAAANIGKWSEWKKAFAKLPPYYKAGACLITNYATWEGYLDGMTDTAGQPIARVNYGISEGVQDRFAGKEVIQVEDSVLPSYTDASTGDTIAVLMNPAYYCINSNMQLSVYRYKDEDLNQWVDKALMVADGKLIDPNAVILIQKGA